MCTISFWGASGTAEQRARVEPLEEGFDRNNKRETAADGQKTFVVSETPVITLRNSWTPIDTDWELTSPSKYCLAAYKDPSGRREMN